MNVCSRFCQTAAYVTSLPFPARNPDETTLSGLAKYLSLVGVLIGVILVFEATLLIWLNTAPILTGVILGLSWLAITGGIHMDGLMDTADGIFSRQSLERMLEIMSDPRVGNFGAMSGFAVLMLKAAALSCIANVPHLVLALLLIPTWARWCETVAIGAFPYAKPEGMGKIWHDTTKFPADLVTATIPPLAFSIACVSSAGWQAVVVIAGTTITGGLLAASMFARLFKGQTGDTYGAVVEFAETIGLTLAAIILTQRHLFYF